MVSATCSSARCVTCPRQHELDALGDVDGGEHVAAALLGEVGPRHDAVGQRARLEAGAQQLGQAARAAQLGDLLEHAAQLAGQRLDAGRRAGIAQDLGVGVRRAALGGVDGGDAGPGLDADDGDRLAGRQGADVGDLGDDGELVVAGAQQHAGRRRRRAPLSTARRSWSVTRASVMTAPGQDGGRQLGQGKAGGRGRGGASVSLMHRRVSIASSQP